MGWGYKVGLGLNIRREVRFEPKKFKFDVFWVGLGLNLRFFKLRLAEGFKIKVRVVFEAKVKV